MPRGKSKQSKPQPNPSTTRTPRSEEHHRGPISAKEWALSIALVGLAGGAFALNNLSPGITPTSDHSASAMAVPTPSTIAAAELASAMPSDGQTKPKRGVHAPVLGQAADTATLDAIRKGLDPVLQKFPKEGAGAVLIDPSGQVVTGLNEDEPMMPASTIKVATGTALWNTFGPDHHFSTKLMARGDISPDGVLNGDLYFVGDGDPTMMSELAIHWKVRPPRPTLSMGDVAEVVKKAGVKSITGSVVGIDNLYKGDTTAKGWKDSYIGEQNATYIHSLSVDRGLVIVPKQEKGSRTAASERTTKAVYHPTQIGEQEPDDFETITSPDTRLDAAAALTQSLSARGITVGGQPGSADVIPADAKEVAKVPSPALRQMIDWIELRSDNHMADMLVRRLDIQNGGDGSFESAGPGVIDHIEQLGIDTANMVMEDGSGLSRDDRTTPTQLANVVLRMGYTDPDWLGSLAVMGESGTTASRLKNTAAQGRWHGKTGSLDDVVSYAGAIRDRQNGVWTVALIANSKEGVKGAEPLHNEFLLTLANLLVPPPTFERSEATTNGQ